MAITIMTSLVLPLACVVCTCDAFYVPKEYGSKMTIHIPDTLFDLKLLLCSRPSYESPCDDKPKKIIVNKLFDFTRSEGRIATGVACNYAFDNTCQKGKFILAESGKCEGKPTTTKKYSSAGLNGIDVGSNKIIVGNKGGGIKGKGLKLVKVSNVEIRNLIITDINADMMDAGSAIEMQGATNVLVEGNIFQNIGHHMILTRLGSTTGVTISSNQFDGNTKYSYHCDGTHMHVWSFMGESERIRLKHNLVFNTGGRTPYVAAQKDTKTIVHLYQNMFYDLRNQAAVQVEDARSSVLVEGNVYNIAADLADEESEDNVYVIHTETEEEVCEMRLNRDCLSNTLWYVKDTPVKATRRVLTDFQDIASESGASSFWSLM